MTGGDGTALSPYQIADVYGLQGIGEQFTDPAERQLSAGQPDIDASGTASWNGRCQGFQPIGNRWQSLHRQPDGQGFTINALMLAPNNATTQSVGLFGTIGAGGSVMNLNFTNASVAANIGFQQPKEGQPVRNGSASSPARAAAPSPT